jgi:hypothetical protein
MVLSNSRRLFLRFYPGASMPFFVRGHVEAFDAVGGAARVLLYNNLKSAVLERRDDAFASIRHLWNSPRIPASEPLERDTVHIGAVRQITDRRRFQRGLPPPVSVPVIRGEHGDLVVKRHALATYDALKKKEKK